MSELAKRLASEFEDKDYAHAYMGERGDAAIAAQIRVLREQRGWTQAELATRAGMKQSRISALEDVNYDAWTVKTLRKLAEAFDVHVDVKFIPFTEAILDVANFRRESMEVVSRKEDLDKWNTCRLWLATSSGSPEWRTSNHLAEVTNIEISPVSTKGIVRSVSSPGGWMSAAEPERMIRRG